MRYHALIAILLPLFSYGQSPGSTASSSSVAGTIEMPSLVDMSISSAVTDKISINNFEDFAYGKTYPSYFKVHVRSNRPWNISVLANTNHLSSTASGGQKIPTNIISLKAETNNEFVSLSHLPKPFMHNVNDKIENTYNVDLKIESPLNYYGGNYDFNLVFIITAL